MVCGSVFFYDVMCCCCCCWCGGFLVWAGFCYWYVSQRFLISGQKTKESQIMESLNNVKQNALYEYEWMGIGIWMSSIYLLNHCRYFAMVFNFIFIWLCSYNKNRYDRAMPKNWFYFWWRAYNIFWVHTLSRKFFFSFF